MSDTPLVALAGHLVNPTVIERRGRALLHWMNPPQVRPYYYAAGVTTPAGEEAFVSLWEKARSAPPTSPLSGTQPVISPLPASLQAQTANLKKTRLFREQYEPNGASDCAVVQLDGDLLTPQVWVDEEYVDELAAELPPVDDENALFDFCFPTGRLDLPALGLNGGAVTSHRREIGGVGPPRLAKYTPDRVTLEFDVVARPNWLSVAVVQDPGVPAPRVMIRNGVHRMLALLKAGRQTAYCLFQAGGLGDVGLNFQDVAMFQPNRIASQRPPLLRDYLDPALAEPVDIRAMTQVLRFALAPDLGFVPRQG